MSVAPSARNCSRRAWGASGPCSKIARSWSSGASFGIERRRLNTTGRGSEPSQSRTVSAGRSRRAVSPPTNTASTRALSSCTCVRASRPVIHLEWPLAVARQPSSVMAPLRLTQGLPCVIHLKNGACRRSHSERNTPTITSTPASVSRRVPRPLTSGLGSVAPTTTRLTPAFISASAHGPDRPVCEQGSSVTYTVAPTTLSPASRAASSAQISACLCPGGSVTPTLICAPAASKITQPTRGLGAVLTMLARATRIASATRVSSRVA